MNRFTLALGLAALATAGGFATSARAASIQGLPPELAQAIDDLQATMYPPVLDTVEVGAPAAGAAVSVKAKFKKSSDKGEGAEEAALYFSTDACKTWTKVDMSGSGGDFKADIPGQAAGTTVNYILTAKDLNENLYTEISCKAVTAEGADFPGDDGWHPLAANEGEPDGTPEIGDPTDADLNMLEPRIAVNDAFMYFEMNVKGKIKDGTTSPMKIHAHAAGVLNRDNGDDDLLKGIVLVYAPLAKLANYAPCMAVYEKGGAPNLDQTNAKCKAENGRLRWRTPRSLIGENKSGQVKTMMLTGAITAISPLAGGLKDHTRISLVNLTALRSYKVP